MSDDEYLMSNEGIFVPSDRDLASDNEDLAAEDEGLAPDDGDVVMDDGDGLPDADEGAANSQQQSFQTNPSDYTGRYRTPDRSSSFYNFDTPRNNMYRLRYDEERDIEINLHQVRTHFNKLHDFEFDAVVGSGVYGLACRVIQRGRSRKSRKLIVKRALNEDSASTLRNEIRLMLKLNGSVHIANVVATLDGPCSKRQSLALFRRVVARLRHKQNAFLVGLAGPTLVLENLEHGTLLDFIEKIMVAGRVVPNRLLWRIYFCLVKACVAMRFPQNKPPDSQPSLERRPQAYLDQNIQPGYIVHEDMHTANILFGSAGDFPEHRLIPPVKLIDFGLARLDTNAEQINLRDVSKVMINIITGAEAMVSYDRHPFEDIETMLTAFLPTAEGLPYPTLDQDLRSLLCYVFAWDLRHRPSLARVYRTIRFAIDLKTPETYGDRQEEESDLAIVRLLQEFLYDA